MNRLAKILATTAMAACMAGSALAADIKLTISNWVPPTHPMTTEMLAGLIDMMSEATDGQVTGEIKNGLAPPPAQMDLVLDGAADIAVIFNGYTPGRFVATKLIELPGYEGNAEAGSVAYWRVYDKYLKQADEHKGVKVIALTTHGVGQIHANKKVESLADLNGLKTRLGGGVAADVGAELGLIGIQVPAPKVYETMASGAADAVAMPVEGRISFKLSEVGKNLYEMPGGFYRGAFSVIMNQEKFDSMPEDIQKALEEKVFGEPASKMMGESWDRADAAAHKLTEETADNTITIASDADQEKFKGMAAKVQEKILGELEAAGIDAKAAYDMTKSEMSGYGQ